GAELLFAGGHDAAVAAGNMFGILERKAADLANGAERFASIERTPALRTVFNQDEAMLVSDGLQLGQFAWIAGQVDGDDGFGFGRDFPLDVGRVQAAGVRFQISKYWHRLLE